MKSVEYNLPLLKPKKKYWKFVEIAFNKNFKDSDYFYKFYNDLEVRIIEI
jgi:hypothetical protein